MRKSIELLQRAHSYIEAGELSEARALLEPALDANPDDPDLWWFYAHALEDPDKGVEALENVARLDPTYPGIDELTARIQEADAVDVAGYEEAIDEMAFDDVDYEKSDGSAETKSGQRRWLPLVALLVIVVCLGLVALLLSNQGQGGQPSATDQVALEGTTPPTSAAVAVLPSITPFPTEQTEEPTAIPQESLATPAEDTAENGQPEATEVDVAGTQTDESPAEATESASTEAVTDTLDDELISELRSSLESYQVPEDGIYETETSLGRTLVVRTCAAIGPQATSSMNGIFESLGDRADQSLAAFDGFAVEVNDCNTNQPIRTIAVEKQAALDFASGTIDLRGFQRFWQPIN